VHFFTSKLSQGEETWSSTHIEQLSPPTADAKVTLELPLGHLVVTVEWAGNLLRTTKGRD
jgi:hypothetical protein